MVGDQEVGPGGEDGEKKAHGDPVSQEGPGPSLWGGEALHKGEGGVDQGQAVVVVVGGVQGGRKPVAQPSHYTLWVEDLVVKGDGRESGGGPFAVGPPVDEFGFRDGEGEVEFRSSPGYDQEKVLQTSYVGPVRRRCHCEGEIIHVRDHDARWDVEVEGGDVDEEEKR